MLLLLPKVAAGLTPATLDRMARLVGQLPLPALRRRARNQAHARAVILGAETAIDRPSVEVDPSARAAVVDHARFVAEFLASLGGREARIGATPKLLLAPAPRGRLVVTLHTGNWVVAAAALSRALGELHTVAGTQLHPRLEAAVGRHFLALGVTLHRGPGAAARLLNALRAGKTVVLHLDGSPSDSLDDPVDAERERAIEAPAELEQPLGVRAAASLATRSGADVCFALCRREAPGAFRFEAHSLTPPSSRSRLDARRAWSSLFRALLHDEVAAHPDHWMIFRTMRAV